MGKEKYYCISCGWETDYINDLDTNGDCERCRKVHCDECNRLFERSELSNGLCDSCANRLAKECEKERREMEREYWDSKF